MTYSDERSLMVAADIQSNLGPSGIVTLYVVNDSHGAELLAYSPQGLPQIFT